MDRNWGHVLMSVTKQPGLKNSLPCPNYEYWVVIKVHAWSSGHFITYFKNAPFRSVMVLFDLWRYLWSELVLFDLRWFFLMYNSSAWSALVLFDLSWFFLISDSSFWLVMVLCNLCWLFLIWAGSFWSVMVLCDLSWFFLICDVLCDRGWFFLNWADSFWSELFLFDRW